MDAIQDGRNSGIAGVPVNTQVDLWWRTGMNFSTQIFSQVFWRDPSCVEE